MVSFPINLKRGDCNCMSWLPVDRLGGYRRSRASGTLHIRVPSSFLLGKLGKR